MKPLLTKTFRRSFSRASTAVSKASSKKMVGSVYVWAMLEARASRASRTSASGATGSPGLSSTSRSSLGQPMPGVSSVAHSILRGRCSRPHCEMSQLWQNLQCRLQPTLANE